MQYYSTREWKGKKALVTIGKEKVILDLMQMPEDERWAFILWRMGLALDEPNPPKLLVGESIPVPASRPKKVREYTQREQPRRVQKVERRR